MYWAAIFLLGGMLFSRLVMDREWLFSGSLAIYILLSITRFGLFSGKSKYWLLACFILGSSYYAVCDITNRTALGSFSEGEAKIEGKIISSIDYNGDVVKFELRVEKCNEKEVSERVLCRIKLGTNTDTNLISLLKPGKRLSFRAMVIEPETARNPGSLDYKQLLHFKRIHWIVQPNTLTTIQVTSTPVFSLDAALYSWQTYLSHVIEDTFPKELSSLMKGLLLGIQSDLDPEISDIYKLVGLAHVLAISGLHMTILIQSILFLIGLLGIAREKALLTTCFVLPIYTLLAGASPSIVRAGLMSIILLLGSYLKRPTDTLNIWGTVLFCMLVWDPYQLWDVGFQLSFGCVWGLIYLCPYITKPLSFLGQRLSTYLSIGFAAQLCSYPFSIFYFHHYFLLSFFVNLLFVPLYSLLFIPIGFLALGLGLIHPGFAYLTVRLLNIIYVWMTGLLIEVSHLSWADLFISEPSYFWLAAYYIALVHGLWIMKERIGLWIGFLTAAILFSILPIPVGRDKVSITFLDVGQGDAIVIQTKTQTTLIDAGGINMSSTFHGQQKPSRNVYDAGRAVVIPYLQWRGINKLDYLVATHGDLDHIGGMASVLRKMTVKNFLGNGKQPTTNEEKEMLRFLDNHRIPIHPVLKGWTWMDGQEIRWTVLNPIDTMHLGNDNNNSIVLLLEAFGYRVLFTGDLERAGEQELLGGHSAFAPVDILKVGHHGSRTSTTEDWVRTLRPTISIISVGRKNRYGHPHQETLQVLEHMGSQIYRTDQQGAITIEIKKDGVRVYPFLQQVDRAIRQ